MRINENEEPEISKTNVLPTTFATNTGQDAAKHRTKRSLIEGPK